VWCTSALEGVEAGERWPGLTSLVMVDSTRHLEDQFKGTVKKGDLWRDVIRIPQAKLNYVTAIGLGVTRPPSETFHIDHGLTDWDGHRLAILVK
jgi:hypothetical protein